MGRPIPHIPRGPRRAAFSTQAYKSLLGVPRVCPLWELHALRALIKPQFKEAITHRPSDQKWSRGDVATIERAHRALRDRLHEISPALARQLPAIHLPTDGEYRMIALYPIRRQTLARLLAITLSRALPKHWLTVGSLLVHEGRMYRRTGLRRLEIAVVRGTRWPSMLKPLVEIDHATSSHQN